jgi:uncharacterized protein (DUF302 family)
MTIRHSIVGLFLVVVVLLLPLLPLALAAESGLVTKPSQHSVQETIERFETAVRAKGWVVFTELDHAAAAAKVGLQLRPRTVIVFGNPKLGTAPMQNAATLAIDNPLKALVWQDDQSKVWLTYNSGAYQADYIYPRHGLTGSSDMRKTLEQFLDGVSEDATK